MKVLVIGYGNPGRGDDGLGPALAREVAALGLDGVETDSNYQLNVEDAARMEGFDVAVFADAAVKGPAPFFFQEIGAGDAAPAAFTTHHLAPADVVALSRTLYGWAGRAFLLGMRGREFDEFRESLSEDGARHLEAARAFLVKQIEGGFAAPTAPVSCEVTP